ncbi:MAG: FAD-dependent oxidoreductase [Bacteroidia bacterium]|nr:FAD-dependent oxidoreductase [Bacteroidia bacterium]
MKKPIIFVVDDDEQVLKAIYRDVRSRYRQDYRILSTTSAREALESLAELKKKGETVALFLSDQKMPEMLGVDFLEKARVFYPEAKKVLLTAYSDTDAAIKSINDVGLDYYLMKPWDPPEEKLFPTLDDLLQDWQAGYRPEFQGIRVVGFQFAPKSHKIKDFLSGNLIPYQWLDIESNPKAKELQELFGVELKELPLVIFEDGTHLLNPSPQEIAERSGLKPRASSKMYDVVIIGAGPAGLSAAVYGASEGLKTLLVEKRAPGGQAGTSSRIENYLGFPTGLSGADLARRAITQATRFGAEFLSPQEITSIKTQDNYKILSLSDGNELHSRAVVITTGVDYRRLEAIGIENFTGAGVYYGAATTEAAACAGRDVFIVGGGNSAGQGAMYLSQFARKVYIVVRKKDLVETMSSYLIDQINGTENIEVVGNSVIREARGDDRLSSVVLENLETGKVEEKEAVALFVFIGARPYTDWLHESILKDDKGFVATGEMLKTFRDYPLIWKKERDPYLLETCTPGIFAAGDVRVGAMARVASAVGEGAMAISFVHKYLAEV